MLVPQNTKLLEERLAKMIDNPANLYVRPQAFKAYCGLAKKAADKLFAIGRKDEANGIYLALVPYYERMKI